ncbi:hypothetical protein Nepgr_030058 [Nepenthes gracilis]|uniref:Uncharacterized protein n=1 Tax=Nepenthes gracilis TaxID=150966 RepID=A0AAD3Y5G9_NEPGR|nr:hypothetical protein Nepgr_030058 [Nepenthes gracilis]
MLMILKLVLWMDLLPRDGGSASGLNPLYLAGLADHLFDPADVLNLPGGFLAGLVFYLDDGLCKPICKGSFAGMALYWRIPASAVVATGMV